MESSGLLTDVHRATAARRHKELLQAGGVQVRATPVPVDAWRRVIATRPSARQVSRNVVFAIERAGAGSRVVHAWSSDRVLREWGHAAVGETQGQTARAGDGSLCGFV